MSEMSKKSEELKHNLAIASRKFEENEAIVAAKSKELEEATKTQKELEAKVEELKEASVEYANDVEVLSKAIESVDSRQARERVANEPIFELLRDMDKTSTRLSTNSDRIAIGNAIEGLVQKFIDNEEKIEDAKEFQAIGEIIKGLKPFGTKLQRVTIKELLSQLNKLLLFVYTGEFEEIEVVIEEDVTDLLEETEETEETDLPEEDVTDLLEETEEIVDTVEGEIVDVEDEEETASPKLPVRGR